MMQVNVLNFRRQRGYNSTVPHYFLICIKIRLICLFSFFKFQRKMLTYLLCHGYLRVIQNTGYAQKNGAVSKVNKKFISHLTRRQHCVLSKQIEPAYSALSQRDT